MIKAIKKEYAHENGTVYRERILFVTLEIMIVL